MTISSDAQTANAFRFCGIVIWTTIVAIVPMKSLLRFVLRTKHASLVGRGANTAIGVSLVPRCVTERMIVAITPMKLSQNVSNALPAISNAQIAAASQNAGSATKTTIAMTILMKLQNFVLSVDAIVLRLSSAAPTVNASRKTTVAIGRKIVRTAQTRMTVIRTRAQTMISFAIAVSALLITCVVMEFLIVWTQVTNSHVQPGIPVGNTV